jgi:tellurite resistance protein TehA-like permease
MDRKAKRGEPRSLNRDQLCARLNKALILAARNGHDLLIADPCESGPVNVESRRVRSALPFGAVMATGGASQVARFTAFHPLAVPLLWLTVALVVTIPVFGLLRRRWAGDAMLRMVPSIPAEALFGDFTVPVGLAVTGTGLAGLGTSPALGGALCALALAWASTIVVTARVVTPLAIHLPGVAAIDGAWFLAPAAVLADAIATAAVIPRLSVSVRPGLGWLALVACGLGVAGYGLTLALAAVRVHRVGTGNASQALWWVSAGCGGLGAASIGQVATITPVGGESDAADHAFASAALVLWSVASILLVPIVVGSLAYLYRFRRLHGSPPWPPTFSTGVYALGADQAGRLGNIHSISVIGTAAGVATVALWFVTAGLHAVYLSRRLDRLCLTDRE